MRFSVISSAEFALKRKRAVRPQTLRLNIGACVPPVRRLKKELSLKKAERKSNEQKLEGQRVNNQTKKDGRVTLNCVALSDCSSIRL